MHDIFKFKLEEQNRERNRERYQEFTVVTTRIR